MLCNSVTSKKRKMVVLAGLSVATLAVTYFGVTTHNSALAVAAPVLLALAPCLIMCGVIGSSMWLIPRFSKNKNRQYYNDDSHNFMKQKEDKENIFKN